MSDSLALLRGVNVGGNGRLPMAELRVAMEAAGFDDVRTYIQSGNVIFRSEGKAAEQAAALVAVIEKGFGFAPDVAVFTARQWYQVVADAPSWWGRSPDEKHNVLALIKPARPAAVISAIGDLKPELEQLAPGKGVIYHSVSIEGFGRATTGKLAANRVYKQMTVRNYNTAVKLGALLMPE